MEEGEGVRFAFGVVVLDGGELLFSQFMDDLFIFYVLGCVLLDSELKHEIRMSPFQKVAGEEDSIGLDVLLEDLKDFLRQRLVVIKSIDDELLDWLLLVPDFDWRVGIGLIQFPLFVHLVSVVQECT
jgi:hypothetical protein